jgi:hypothetical protein
MHEDNIQILKDHTDKAECSCKELVCVIESGDFVALCNYSSDSSYDNEGQHKRHRNYRAKMVFSNNTIEYKMCKTNVIRVSR